MSNYRLVILSVAGFTIPATLLLLLLLTTLFGFSVSIIFYCNRIVVAKEDKLKLKLASISMLNRYITDSKLYANLNITEYKDRLSYSLHKSKFGIFDNVQVTVKSFRDSAKYNYLIGYKDTSYNHIALTMTCPDFSAVVAGNTEIVGDFRASCREVRRGSIYGIHSSDKRFLKGNFIIDKHLTPKLFSDNDIKNILSREMISGNDIILRDDKDIININEKASSFLSIKYERELYLGKNVKFNNVKKIVVSGKIIIDSNISSEYGTEICSDSDITIRSGSKIENICISSKGSVYIERNSYFKDVQIYAGQNIIIDSSLFDYPTVIGIYVNASDRAKWLNKININSSIINGTIMLITSISGIEENKSRISIDEKSIVQGMIYCENNLDLRCPVVGTVYTYNFWYYKEPTEYINYLVNININRLKLDDWFLYPGIIGNMEPIVMKETCIF